MTIHVRPAEPDPELSAEYYETLARTMGDERAAWARLPREEREKELRWYHDNFNTPDDLAIWPPELEGGVSNP
ncbi:MAG: hypothetical protein L0Z50_27900 [Verrucomicrobiales bacterium]|nr:hypothetical protein [Verrucomicrobiales bacterium]